MVYNNRPIPGIPSIKTPGELQNRQNVQQNGSFADILQNKLNQDVKISKHAQLRMEMRNVSLTDAQRQKLSEAVNKADTKGIRDTLVIMDKMAFVVNVKNRTVITAVNSNELRENVFTNIDGAVFTD